MFFLLGASVATWVVRIPDVQRGLSLSPGWLGVALLGAAAGALLAMPVAGRWVARIGSRQVARITAIIYAVTLPLPALAPNLAWLLAALLVNGAANGSFNVSINAQASTVEGKYGRPIMSGFHALFSGGGLAGAALGGVVAAADVSAVLHLAVSGVSILGALWGASPYLFGRDDEAGADVAHAGAALHHRGGRVLLLGSLAFSVLFAEGAIADWSAVYLRDVALAGPGVAATGYAAFSVMMALGRLVGDRLTAFVGAARVVQVGGALATLGVTLALFDARPRAIAIGFGAVGAGLATAFPSILSAAARIRGLAPGDGIAGVATLGYFGLLAGPPLIGLIAEATSLRGGMLAVGVSCALTTVLARTLRIDANAASPLGGAPASTEPDTSAASLRGAVGH